jgi:Ni,Fe-hydrogenase III component G
MIIVKKVVLYAAFFIMGALIIMLGVVNYVRLTNIGIDNIQLIKFYGDNLLYLSIVSVLILLVSVFIIQRGGIRVLKEIDKVTELSGYGRYYSGEYMKKLGRLGEKINRLFLELNRLNDMKSLKISAVSNINAFFLDNTHLHLFITDIEGTIQSCARVLLDKLKIEVQDMRSSNFSDFIKDLDFNELVVELQRSYKEVKREKVLLTAAENSFQSQFVFYPVLNVKNELSNIICVSGKETLLASISKRAEQISKAQRKITDVFRKKNR